MSSLIDQNKAFEAHEVKKAEIQAESIGAGQKKKKLSALGDLDPKHVTNCSAWWGIDGATVTIAKLLPPIDLAIAKLDPFDPDSVAQYPVFKDPAKDVGPGVSLCKLGFPFHSIAPKWDSSSKSFHLPDAALPIPFFPIEGIFTRTVEFVAQAGPPSQYPLQWIETSSPGLKGQSGGPILDTKGTVWGIQVNTAHYPLGFNPSVPGRAEEKVHQFLNVGRGVHSSTILGFFQENGIAHHVSQY